MRITCNMAMDLAGLYIDHLASKDSERAIKSHLRTCPACCRYYQEFSKEKEEVQDAQIAALPTAVPEDYMKNYSHLSGRIRKRRNFSIALMATVIGSGAAMLTLGILKFRKSLK